MSDLPILLVNTKNLNIAQTEDEIIDFVERGRYTQAIALLKKLIKEIKDGQKSQTD